MLLPMHAFDTDIFCKVKWLQLPFNISMCIIWVHLCPVGYIKSYYGASTHANGLIGFTNMD